MVDFTKEFENRRWVQSSNGELPSVVKRFVAANDRKDLAAQRACFANDAVVIALEGWILDGVDAITAWRKMSNTRFGYRFEVLDVRRLRMTPERPDRSAYEVFAHLAGDDFDDPRRDIRWRIELKDSLIYHVGVESFDPETLECRIG